MFHKYSTLRMMILASVPCVASSAGLAATQTSFANLQTLASNESAPSIVTLNTIQPVIEMANTDAIKTASAIIEVASDSRANPVASTASIGIDIQTLMLSLVGIFINGKERDTVEVLYDPNTASTSNSNNHYYLSVADLVRLTAVSVTEEPNSTTYNVSTPIGDTSLSAAQVLSHQEQNYIALSDLKKLGISAEYSQSDLAVMLNMGWRPMQAAALTQDSTALSLPIDYRPARAGLLGLSFNSSLTASENYVTQDNSQTDNQTATNRQVYADIGAFGYGLGGAKFYRSQNTPFHFIITCQNLLIMFLQLV